MLLLIHGSSVYLLANETNILQLQCLIWWNRMSCETELSFKGLEIPITIHHDIFGFREPLFLILIYAIPVFVIEANDILVYLLTMFRFGLLLLGNDRFRVLRSGFLHSLSTSSLLEIKRNKMVSCEYWTSSWIMILSLVRNLTTSNENKISVMQVRWIYVPL